MSVEDKEFSNQWKEFEDLNKKLRENIKLMAGEKKNLLSKHGDDQKKGKKEIDRLYDETCKMFTYLKSLQQKSLTRREKSQNTLNNLCNNVDAQSLKLKNFEYEQVDTMKQIAICDDYHSNIKEPQLISKKEFYENNREQIQITNIHQEKTKRLQYELQQRKELQSDLRNITQKVKTLNNELTEKKAFLGSLQSKIGNIFNSIKPLQEYMKLPSPMLYPNESEIDSLPAPLFTIYQSFTTQIHCHHKLDQEIKIKITKRTQNDIKNHIKSKPLVIPKKINNNIVLKKKNENISNDKASVLGKRKYEVENNENLEDGEIGSVEPQRKKQRTSNYRSNKDRDKDKRDRDRESGKKSKKHKSRSSKSKNKEEMDSSSNIEHKEKENIIKRDNRMSVEMSKLIDKMKLNVVFKVIGIELEFMYCSTYNLVLVTVKRQRISNRNKNDDDNGWKYEDPTVFMELFDGHKMIELPDILNKQQRLLENASLVPYFCAFSWAQELGGSYIFDTISKTKKKDRNRKREIVNLNTLRTALKGRKANRICLENQLKQLMTLTMNDNNYQLFIKNIQKIFDNENNKSFPMNKLLSFKLMRNAEYNNKYNRYFELILERSPYSLHCIIEIAPSYPNNTPLFHVINIINNKIKMNDNNNFYINSCKNMEIKLNGDFGENVNDKNKHLLLSMMIYKLQRYFDVYIESLQSNNNDTDCNEISDAPKRIHRGRDRRQQF